MKSLLEVLWRGEGGSKSQEKNGHLWMAPMPIEQSQHRCWEKVNKYSTFHSGRLRFAFLARKFYSKSHANFGDRPMGNQRKNCTLCFLTVFIYRKVASSRQVYYSILDFFVQSSEYISIKFPLHKRSENALVCY